MAIPFLFFNVSETKIGMPWTIKVAGFEMAGSPVGSE